MLPQPYGQASKYRKAPPVTPERFALPHEIGPVFRDSHHANRLPPLIKTTMRDARPSSKDTMEEATSQGAHKSALLRILSRSSDDAASQFIDSSSQLHSLPVGVDQKIQLDSSLEKLLQSFGPQNIVPNSRTYIAETRLRFPPAGCSSQPPSALFPVQTSALITLKAEHHTALSPAISPQAPCSAEEELRFFRNRVGRHSAGVSVVTPLILLQEDLCLPLIAVPPPGGWSGDAAIAMAIEEVRAAAVEEQEGETGARRTTVKHSTGHGRTKVLQSESRAMHQKVKPSKVVEKAAMMWQSRSERSRKCSGVQSRPVVPMVLGQHLARGTPTPKTWIRHHGDQRVPLMLTVTSNHTPYRLPPMLQEIVHAERQAATHAAEIAANPPPVPEAAVGRIGEVGGQDVGDVGNKQIRTLSAGSKDLGRQASQLSKQTSQMSRCNSEMSAHSVASNQA